MTFQLPKENPQPNIRQIAASDWGLYAVDTENRVWKSNQWYTDFCHKKANKFHQLPVETWGHRIRKIVVGRRLNFALLEDGLGIVAWADATDTGKRCDIKCRMITSSIGLDIADIETCTSRLLILDSQGRLLDMPIKEPIAKNFDPGASFPISELEEFTVKGGRTWKLIAAYSGDAAKGLDSLGAVNEDGAVFTASLSDTKCSVRKPVRLPDHDIPVSLKLGLWHKLAQGSSGNVYTWGGQDDRDGTFGLGCVDDLCKSASTHNVVYNDYVGRFHAPSPIQVPLDLEMFMYSVQIATSEVASFAVCLSWSEWDKKPEPTREDLFRSLMASGLLD